MIRLENSLHTVICGRTRKNIRLIESTSNTAIYFPPPFPRVYGYTPPAATRRGDNEVFITGESMDNIKQAKAKLHELVMNTKCYVKEVQVLPPKVDSILLDRLEKVRKVMELNGTYVLFPSLGSTMGKIRVQGTEILHVERTVREIMALVGGPMAGPTVTTNYFTGWPILQCYMVDFATRSSTGSSYACSIRV